MFFWKYTNKKLISYDIIVGTLVSFLLFIVWIVGAAVNLRLFDSSQTNEILGIFFTVVFLILALGFPSVIGYKAYLFAKKEDDKQLMLMAYLQMVPLGITQMVAFGFAVANVINLFLANLKSIEQAKAINQKSTIAHKNIMKKLSAVSFDEASLHEAKQPIQPIQGLQKNKKPELLDQQNKAVVITKRLPKQKGAAVNFKNGINIDVLEDILNNRLIKSKVEELNKMVNNKISSKSWTVTLLISLFFGITGADRFYVGKIGTGLGKLFTLGGLGIWGLVDFILICCGDFTDAEGKPVRDSGSTDETIGVAKKELYSIVLDEYSRNADANLSAMQELEFKEYLDKSLKLNSSKQEEIN